MIQENYAESRAFVREMWRLVAGRDLASIHQAVLQMQDWLEKDPHDPIVGTALEEFDILEEAAQIVEQKRQNILIRFPDSNAESRALGFLPGRYSFKSWVSGEMAVPETALAALAAENIPFCVEGKAPYERLVSPVRNVSAETI